MKDTTVNNKNCKSKVCSSNKIVFKSAKTHKPRLFTCVVALNYCKVNIAYKLQLYANAHYYFTTQFNSADDPKFITLLNSLSQKKKLQEHLKM